MQKNVHGNGIENRFPAFKIKLSLGVTRFSWGLAICEAPCPRGRRDPCGPKIPWLHPLSPRFALTPAVIPLPFVAEETRSSHGQSTVRTLASLFLTGLILACPFLCGAAEAFETAHEHSGSESPSPAHCPDDSDSCICRGAVQAHDVRVPDFDGIGLPLGMFGLVGIVAHSSAHPLAHMTSDGHPTGLAAWGSSLAVRAFLQNFRC